MNKKIYEIAADAINIGIRTFDTYFKDATIVENNEGKDIKLKIDRTIEQRIIDHLKENSDFGIITEESGVHGNKTEFQWVLDPLDGSMNLNRGIPHYAISLALLKGGKPHAGYIYDLNNFEFYHMDEELKPLIETSDLTVSKVDDITQAVLMTGFPSKTNFDTENLMTFVRNTQDFKKVRLIGSAALSLAYVASGKADAYQENGIRLWDVAAGLALVKAAGGDYTMSKPDNEFKVNVYAHNGLLSKQLFP